MTEPAPVATLDNKVLGVKEGDSWTRITVPVGTTMRDFRGLLIAVEHCYNGQAVDAKTVALHSGTNLNLVLKIFGLEEFQQAAKLRGTPLVPHAGLTEQQMLALPILLDYSIPTLAQRLRKAGITQKDYGRWKRSPAFRQELNRLAGGMLQEAEVDTLTSLTAAAANGDLRAMELSLEITGTHDRKDKTQVELRAFALQVLEILTDEVKDSETLTRIAARIAMAQGAPVPTQTPLREISNG